MNMIGLFVSLKVIYSGFAAVARKGFRSVKCRVRNISSASSTTITFLRAVKKSWHKWGHCANVSNPNHHILNWDLQTLYHFSSWKPKRFFFTTTEITDLVEGCRFIQTHWQKISVTPSFLVVE